MRTYYQALVEHYFRMAVRYKQANSPTAQKWCYFTRQWIEKQSEADKRLILVVFDSRYRTTNEGIHSYNNGESINQRYARLSAIERQFAIDINLIDNKQEEFRNEQKPFFKHTEGYETFQSQN